VGGSRSSGTKDPLMSAMPTARAREPESDERDVRAGEKDKKRGLKRKKAFSVKASTLATAARHNCHEGLYGIL